MQTHEKTLPMIWQENRHGQKTPSKDFFFFYDLTFAQRIFFLLKNFARAKLQLNFMGWAKLQRNILGRSEMVD